MTNNLVSTIKEAHNTRKLISDEIKLTPRMVIEYLIKQKNVCVKTYKQGAQALGVSPLIIGMYTQSSDAATLYLPKTNDLYILYDSEIKTKELILKGKKEGRKLLRDSGYADHSGTNGLVKRGKEFVSDAKDTADINYRKSRLKTKKTGRPVVRKIPRTIDEIESRGRRLKRKVIRNHNNKIIKRGTVSPIVKKANNESRIRQKNGGYAVPKNQIERRAEGITRINQRNGKFTNRKKHNNAVGAITNAARMVRIMDMIEPLIMVDLK